MMEIDPKDSLPEKIDNFLKLLSELTKDEADLIETVLTWDGETQSAYMFAKRIFESEDE